MLIDYLNVDLNQALSLDKLPPEKKQALLQKMSTVLQNRISIQAIELLSEADQAELERIIDSGGDMITFLKSKIPNFEFLIGEITANFKQEMIEMYGLTQQETSQTQN